MKAQQVEQSMVPRAMFGASRQKSPHVFRDKLYRRLSIIILMHNTRVVWRFRVPTKYFVKIDDFFMPLVHIIYNI